MINIRLTLTRVVFKFLLLILSPSILSGLTLTRVVFKFRKHCNINVL